MRRSEVIIERTFSQEDFDRFASLSGDDNPIHVDERFSARSRFGRPVAHGLLLVSVLRGLADRLAPGSRVVDQSVMFPAPTYADEAMRFRAAITGSGNDDVTINLEVSRAGDGAVTCQGKCRMAP